jgi:hypothetical protein
MDSNISIALKTMKIKILVFFFLFLIFRSFAQNDQNDKYYGHPTLSFHYSLNSPIFEWKSRFGLFNSLGGQIGYKTKHHWLFMGEGNFIFGNQIKETNILDNLKDSYGNITDDQGNITLAPIFSRGYSASFILGKLIPFNESGNESGLLFNLGLGILSYKYRIETNSVNVPQIEGDYTKGYDRLTSGLLFSQFVGYQYVSSKSLYNFYLGLHFQQGLTYNQRTVFFDKPQEVVSTKMRIDGSYGLKFGWNIPFFSDKPKEFYYY